MIICCVPHLFSTATICQDQRWTRHPGQCGPTDCLGSWSHTGSTSSSSVRKLINQPTNQSITLNKSKVRLLLLCCCHTCCMCKMLSLWVCDKQMNLRPTSILVSLLPCLARKISHVTEQVTQCPLGQKVNSWGRTFDNRYQISAQIHLYPTNRIEIIQVMYWTY